MRRAAVSILASIAEGFRHRGRADKARFMNMAEGFLDSHIPQGYQGRSPWLVGFSIGRIEQVLDLVDAPSGVTITNLNESPGVRRCE